MLPNEWPDNEEKFEVTQIRLAHTKRYEQWCREAYHNDTQHNDTQHNDTQQNDTQRNDTQHNEIQHNGT
jgi:hypothetical protein